MGDISVMDSQFVPLEKKKKRKKKKGLSLYGEMGKKKKKKNPKITQFPGFVGGPQISHPFRRLTPVLFTQGFLRIASNLFTIHENCKVVLTQLMKGNFPIN